MERGGYGGEEGVLLRFADFLGLANRWGRCWGVRAVSTLIHRRTLMKRMYPSPPTAALHMMRSSGMLVATSHANHPMKYLPTSY